MNIKKQVKEIESKVISMRRYFHENPELSWDEYNTSNKIKQVLDDLNIEYKNIAKTGVVAKIGNCNYNKVIVFRTDMDALPIEEKNEVSYASKNKGVMHACGHDAHIAMLLGVAEVLKKNEASLQGQVILLFQPAEETMEGAKAVLEDLDIENIDLIYSMHIWSGLQSGKISLEEGPRMASSDKFNIKIKGKSSHGSTPHLGVDAVTIASSIVLNLQMIPSRLVNPLEPVVLTVGSIIAGTEYNIIANEARLEGTVRTFDNSLRSSIEEDIEKISKNIADSFNSTIEYRYLRGTSPVINDQCSSNIARQAAEKVVGSENIVKMEKVMGGEDFSLLQEKINGSLIFLGSANKKKNTDVSHHNEYFNVDESVLKNGVELFVRIAHDYLSSI